MRGVVAAVGEQRLRPLLAAAVVAACVVASTAVAVAAATGNHSKKQRVCSNCCSDCARIPQRRSCCSWRCVGACVAEDRPWSLTSGDHPPETI